MTQTTKATMPVAGKTTLTTRGISRKLLARKSTTKNEPAAPIGDAVEDVFPAAEPDSDGAGMPDPASGMPEPAAPVLANATAPAPAAQPSAITPAEPESAPHSAAPAAPALAPSPAPAWSDADERALQAMLARRRASGFRRRGRDVSSQLIRAGDIAPNPDTVVAVIVGLVAAAGGSLPRGDLLDAMAQAKFPKALAGDRAWCQGYVAGAIRCGFLAVGSDEDLVSPRSVEMGDEVGLANARSAEVAREPVAEAGL